MMYCVMIRFIFIILWKVQQKSDKHISVFLGRVQTSFLLIVKMNAPNEHVCHNNNQNSMPVFKVC